MFKLTEEDRFRLSRKAATIDEIAEKYGVHPSTVKKVRPIGKIRRISDELRESIINDIKGGVPFRTIRTYWGFVDSREMYRMLKTRKETEVSFKLSIENFFMFKR